jgi:hypothetical protein
MEDVGQVILLVRGAPHGHTLADPAQVDRLLAGALRHFAPVPVANPAKIAADIADHHLHIRTLKLIAHRVHLCITDSTAQHYATGARPIVIRSVVLAPNGMHCYRRLIVARASEESSRSLYKNDKHVYISLYTIYKLMFRTLPVHTQGTFAGNNCAPHLVRYGRNDFLATVRAGHVACVERSRTR